MINDPLSLAARGPVGFVARERQGEIGRILDLK
jgi:hypothetical protein